MVNRVNRKETREIAALLTCNAQWDKGFVDSITILLDLEPCAFEANKSKLYEMFRYNRHAKPLKMGQWQTCHGNPESFMFYASTSYTCPIKTNRGKIPTARLVLALIRPGEFLHVELTPETERARE